jgi:signal transduction histidine kinase
VKPRFIAQLFNPPEPGEEEKDLLVLKGNQLHVGILWIVGAFSLCYVLLNIYFGLFVDAAINFTLIPAVFVYHFLFVKNKAELSKILNLIHVSLVIGLHSLIHGPETFILSFFFPVIISTLIVFQGTQTRLGYLLAAFIFVWILSLLRAGIVFSDFDRLSAQQLENEWLFNLGGAILVTVLEVAYIMYLSNKIQNALLAKQELLNKQNLVLAESIAGREKLISIMSHDLRGPLTLIQSGIQILSDDDLAAAQRQEILQHLNKKTQASVQLLDNLLLWSRSQSAQIRFKPEPIGVKEIEQMLNQIFNLYTGEKKVKMSANCIMFVSVHADRQMLETILRNLVSNAIKFTPDGGEVFVHAIGNNGLVEFTVRDTGRGMDEQMIYNIQSGASTSTIGTRQEKGHGLGLPLVKYFIEAHKSHLTIRSKPNEGTLFSFSIEGKSV